MLLYLSAKRKGSGRKIFSNDRFAPNVHFGICLFHTLFPIPGFFLDISKRNRYNYFELLWLRKSEQSIPFGEGYQYGSHLCHRS